MLRVEPGIKVVSCVANERESVKEVLLELLYSILELVDAEPV